MCYHIEKMLAVLQLLEPFPQEIKQIIWETTLGLEKEERMKQGAPSIKNGHRLEKMMKRWNKQGQWNRHVRNIQFE